MIKIIHFIKQGFTNKVLTDSFFWRPFFSPLECLNVRTQFKTQKSLFFFHNQIWQKFFQNRDKMRTRCTPFMHRFMLTMTNLIPDRITKSFSKQFNGGFYGHSNLYHGNIITIFFVLKLFSNRDTALSVNNPCKIGIQNFTHYNNVSHHIMSCQKRRYN